MDSFNCICTSRSKPSSLYIRTSNVHIDDYFLYCITHNTSCIASYNTLPVAITLLPVLYHTTYTIKVWMARKIHPQRFVKTLADIHKDCSDVSATYRCLHHRTTLSVDDEQFTDEGICSFTKHLSNPCDCLLASVFTNLYKSHYLCWTLQLACCATPPPPPTHHPHHTC